MSETLRPAERMKGVSLPGGWQVIDVMPRPQGRTGGHFSVAYRVQNAAGESAFMKALDYEGAFKSPDIALALQKMTALYIFERELLQVCAGSSMDRVVRAIAHGSHNLGEGIQSTVEYLIFELADGDARWKFDQERQYEVGWVLRTLHNLTTGLKQLHSAGIAHQDLKPSNVLIFERAKCSKVSDLGSAAKKGIDGPRDQLSWPGDMSYAPPEALYGYRDPEWGQRRLASDVYLLGSMIVFFFCGVSTTTLILRHLDRSLRWDKWSESYSEVLPYVREAFGHAVTEFASNAPRPFSDDLVCMVRELCDPDPAHRGHPRSRAMGAPFALERYIAHLDLLARKAQFLKAR